MGKFRLRKLETFTIDPNVSSRYRATCERYNINASREIESFMRRRLRRR